MSETKRRDPIYIALRRRLIEPVKAADAMIAWTPIFDDTHKPETKGQIEIRQWEQGETDWSKAYGRWIRPSLPTSYRATKAAIRAKVLAEFHAIVVRDGLDPQEVHRAFLVIDEYRAVIADDIEGAD